MNKEKKAWSFNKDNIGILFFYAALALEILIVIVDKSDYINPIEGQLFRLTFLLAAGKVLFTRYSLKEWMWIAVFFLLGFISYRSTGRNEILRIVVFIAACKGVDLKKMAGFVFYTTLGGCLLLMLMSITGIYGNLSITANFGRDIIETRYCLGLGHPNALHCMFFMLVILGLYLYADRMKWYHFLAVLLLNLGLYMLTDSRTGMLITMTFIVMVVVFHYFPAAGRWRWVYIAGIVLFLTCLLLSAAASKYGLENPFLARLDDFLNGRILDLYWGSDNHEGTMVHWSLFSDAGNTYYFDMGFVRVFYWYGIIPAVIYFILNMMLIWQCYRKKDPVGLAMMIVLAIYTVVEAHIISVYIGRNYILLLLGAWWSDMLYAGNKEKEEYLWTGYRLFST